jgi:hypothetical protein
MFRSSWRAVVHLAARATEVCAGQKRGVVSARQTSLATVHKFGNVLTSNFGASGIGRCNVRASNFRPAEMQPATGKQER